MLWSTTSWASFSSSTAEVRGERGSAMSPADCQPMPHVSVSTLVHTCPSGFEDAEW